jgi:hypothetical protein
MNLQINEVNTKQISYEDILSKMGMFVANGKLHLADTNKPTPTTKQINHSTINKSNKQTTVQIENSYIHNKYFKDMLPTSTSKQPKTLAEYQQYLLEEILLQKIAKLRQLNYRKIIIPQPPIPNDEYSDPNKLFDFSKR